MPIEEQNLDEDLHTNEDEDLHTNEDEDLPTDDTPIDPLEPSQHIDNQMICDIQSIASRLVSKQNSY